MKIFENLWGQDNTKIKKIHLGINFLKKGGRTPQITI